MARMGIDEAGRGSLVGPMVIAAVILDEDKEKHLRDLGVRDSKKVSPAKRAELEKTIIVNAKWYKRIVVDPVEIDEENLNKLTLKKMRALAIEGVQKCREVKEIIADSVGRYKGPLLKRLNIQQLIEPRADEKYTVVAAASILAKTLRDRIIQEYRTKYGLKGSGYPGDPRTIEWLMEKRAGIPREIIRLKWRTLKRYGLFPDKEERLDKYMG